MNQLEEILKILAKNGNFGKVKARRSKGECNDVFSLQSPNDKPYVKLELLATRDAIVIDNHPEQTYNLAAGEMPSVADFLHAHLKTETKTRYGPVKRMSFLIEEGRRVQASAQFIVDNKSALNPTLTLANSHLKGELVTKLGQNLVIDGKRNGESPDYHHIRQISSSTLGEKPYYLTDALSCAKFMHKVYALLTR